MLLYRKVSLMFLVLTLTCGLNCRDESSSLGSLLFNSSGSSGATGDSGTVNGLPDLYCNLKATPLAGNNINPAHLDGHNTLMPFPTDVLAYRDISSPTGVRLKITDENLPSQVGQLPEAIQIKTLFKNPDGSDVDGFSATSNVLFEFDRAVDPAWVRDEDDLMARDGGDTFRLLDLTTGEYLPALAMESHHAKDQNMISRDYVMQVMPRGRFEYGRRYMAFVTKKFKDKDGRNFASSTGFLKAKSGDGSDISNFYEPYLQYLETGKGISRDQILAATIFTIRSRESTVAPLTDMFKTILQDNFNSDTVKITGNIDVSGILPAFSRILSGKMLFRSFLDENGVLRYTPGFKGQRNAAVKKNWVPFLFFIPSKKMPKPYPVNILGSGIGMSKELMIYHALFNAQAGVASISIDWVYHGERILNDGISVYELIGWAPGSIQPNGGIFPRLLSMFMHVSLDSMSTYRAVKTYFANSAVEGLCDLDAGNLTYTGVSLGSLCGASAAACMPDLKGAFLHVASVNLNKLLSCGTFLENVIGVSMPKGLTGAWYAVGMDVIVGQQSDVFDGVHFADGFRKGVPEMNTGPRPLAGTFAANDGGVTAEAGVSLIEVAGLPMVVTQEEPENMQDFLENFIGNTTASTFAPYDNYGAIQLAEINPAWNLNEAMQGTDIWNLLELMTSYNFYDISGTLEHILCGASGTAAYYQIDWIKGVQF